MNNIKKRLNPKKMKKILTLAALLLSTAACKQSYTPTVQERAEALMSDEVKKALLLPDSYDPVETKVDSAFAPLCDPKFVSVVLEIQSLDKSLSSLEFQLSYKPSVLSLFGDDESYDKRTKKEYDDEKAKHPEYDALNAKIKTMSEHLLDTMQKEPEFIGYIVCHRFRAKDNDDRVFMDDIFCLTDKELKTVVAKWTPSEMKKFLSYIKQLQEGEQPARL